jgi:hypothetical protein
VAFGSGRGLLRREGVFQAHRREDGGSLIFDTLIDAAR